MMPLTLGMTGMDSETEIALRAAVTAANTKLARRWELRSETDADFIVVDMDSMYGPMSWLRLHAAGKQVIGLTTAARTQADFHLPRPFDAASVAAVLDKAAGPAATTPPPPTAPQPAVPAPVSPPPAPPATAASPPDLATTAAAATSRPEAPASPAPAAPAPAATPAPSPERRLGDWLAPGALSGRLRLQLDGGTLLIDADNRQYHGPAALKPLAGMFDKALERDAFQTLDEAAWASASTAAGAAQPLTRLQWYGGLLAGNGALLPGCDPDGQFKLGKWPQTEREFPKHFRIATTMMKGPATLDEIVQACGVERADVADFINANLASGFAEAVVEAPPEPTEPQKSGLFGRLRGR